MTGIQSHPMFLDSEPREQKRAIARFYDRLSPHFRRLWGPHLHDGYYRTGREDRELAQQQLVEFLAERARVLRGCTVLDIGCGMGATSVWLAEHLGCRPTGITLSQVQVDMARELARERRVDADFRVMDAAHLDFAGTFDLVWMVGVLGHLPDQHAFLSESGRLLRSGGRFLLADWTLADSVSPSDFARFVEPTLRGMLMPQIVSAGEYVRWFEAAGLRTVEVVDITNETRPTWDKGLKIVQAPAVLRLALQLGSDAVELLAAVGHMRRAMRKGLIRYSVLVAQKPDSDPT